MSAYGNPYNNPSDTIRAAHARDVAAQQRSAEAQRRAQQSEQQSPTEMLQQGKQAYDIYDKFAGGSIGAGAGEGTAAEYLTDIGAGELSGVNWSAPAGTAASTFSTTAGGAAPLGGSGTGGIASGWAAAETGAGLGGAAGGSAGGAGGAGGMSGAVSAAGPWAALAAVIGANETWANSEGRRDSQFEDQVADIFTGEVLEQDINDWTGGEDNGAFGEFGNRLGNLSNPRGWAENAKISWDRMSDITTAVGDNTVKKPAEWVGGLLGDLF